MANRISAWRQCLLGFALLTGLLVNAPVHALDVSGEYHYLDHEFEYLVDPGSQLELQQLLANPDAYQFRSSAESKPAPSFDPVWLKLNLRFGDGASRKRYYLTSLVGNLYDIRYYFPGEGGQYEEHITGNDYPASSRQVDSAYYGFMLDTSKTELTVYLRVVGGPGTNKFPWVLVEEHKYDAEVSRYLIVNLMGLTAVAMLWLFGLGLAVTLRRPTYIYYSVYLFSVTMALLTVEGAGFYYLWPDTPALNERAMHSLNMLSAGARLLTIISLMGLASQAPRLYRLSAWVLGLLALSFVVINVWGIKLLPIYAATYVWGAAILVGFACCIYAIKLRIKLALTLFLTLLLPALGAVAQAVFTVNDIGDTAIVSQLAKLGFVLHVAILFAVCLAAQIRLEGESRLLALHDNLTGLPGPTLLRERFEQAANVSRRQGSKIAMFFVDLDGFKAVNDDLGHDAGDKLLIETAKRMKAELRQVDTVARIGGDEFVILLTEVTDLASVGVVAEKLLKAVAAPCRLDQREAMVSASIGIALYPDDGLELLDLRKAADTAMYEAKRRGKNTYVVTDSWNSQPEYQLGRLRIVRS